MLLEVTAIFLFRSPRRGRTAKSDQSSRDANQHDPGYRAGMAPPDQAHVGKGSGGIVDPGRLGRVVLVVAGLNLAYFFVEFAIALTAGSVALLADSVDFLEDTAVNLLIYLALGWELRRRALVGKVMAVVILGPAALAGCEAIQRFAAPVAPEVLPVVLASLGAIVINGTSAILLTTVRHHGGSLSRAAFLSARNDVLVNLSIIAMAVVTLWSRSGWPDLILGCFIILLALRAAREVWEVSEEERLAAKALAGEQID
jgi:Co/Zn/Cd efflux system component